MAFLFIVAGSVQIKLGLDASVNGDTDILSTLQGDLLARQVFQLSQLHAIQHHRVDPGAARDNSREVLSTHGDLRHSARSNRILRGTFDLYTEIDSSIPLLLSRIQREVILTECMGRASARAPAATLCMSARCTCTCVLAGECVRVACITLHLSEIISKVNDVPRFERTSPQR